MGETGGKLIARKITVPVTRTQSGMDLVRDPFLACGEPLGGNRPSGPHTQLRGAIYSVSLNRKPGIAGRKRKLDPMPYCFKGHREGATRGSRPGRRTRPPRTQARPARRATSVELAEWSDQDPHKRPAIGRMHGLRRGGVTVSKCLTAAMETPMAHRQLAVPTAAEMQ